MIILLDTSTSTCFLTIVNGENRQDFEWEAGRTLAWNLLKFLEEKTGDLHLISGIWRDERTGKFYGAENWFDGCEYLGGQLEYSYCWCDG